MNKDTTQEIIKYLDYDSSKNLLFSEKEFSKLFKNKNVDFHLHCQFLLKLLLKNIYLNF